MAIQPVQSLSACKRVHFTFFFTNILEPQELQNVEHLSEGYPYTFQFSKHSHQSTHWHTTGWCYVPRYLFVNGKNLAGPGDEATSCTHPSTRQDVKINTIRDDSNRISFQTPVYWGQTAFSPVSGYRYFGRTLVMQPVTFTPYPPHFDPENRGSVSVRNNGNHRQGYVASQPSTLVPE